MTALRKRVGAALMKRAPTANRKGWLGRLADDLDVNDDTASNWLHGYNSPSAENLEALYERFGKDFANEILGPLGFVVAKADDMAAVAANKHAEAEATIRALKSTIEDYEGKPVKLVAES